ncbi:MAG: PEGA domain-containing protein [Kiritimatiellia bacterium]|nr:PEGA domain-containing protein [Kiritimatiellia bacterium]MDP6811346.1 PEGA domain-containing protein [Kiritimatiellia bacterium]MDP7024387.1 PEGA domain-containing protein [Kiritimatiellia bacterium]
MCLLLLAVVAGGCKTAEPTGRGKICIDVYGRGARDSEAQVFIDGAKECDVSMEKGKGFFLFCAAGQHTVKAEAAGFELYEKKISVKRNTTKWLNVRLKRLDPEEAKPAEKVAEKPAEK